MCAGCVSRREKICGAGRGRAGGAGRGGEERETGYHAEIFEKRNLATVNHLLSSESKSDGFPIEFEIVSQTRLRKLGKSAGIQTNEQNQLVSQRIKKISWYPNQLRKSAGIPTERKGQSKSAGFM